MACSRGSLLLQVLLVATSALTACTGEMAFSFCNNVSPISDTEISLKFASGQQPSLQCTCSVIPTMGHQTLLALSMKLEQFNEGSSNSGSSNDRSRSNVTCEPFAAVVWGNGYQVAQCARKESEDGGNADEGMVMEEDASFQVQANDDPVSVTLHNHKMSDISATVLIKVIQGHVSVQCQPADTSMVWDADTCPCDNTMVMLGAGGTDGFAHVNPSNGSTGAIVAVVCVVVFLLLVALIAGVWWWRKKRQPAGEKDLERVTADNAAYAGSTSASRASGMDRNPDTPQQQQPKQPQYTNVPGPGPYPNEELDLSLRTTPKKQPGSVDSGVHSIPADKHPNHQGNNNYSNVPLGPDQMYNPMLAKQPSVHSLTGQGALHGSVDHLNPPDVVYAQPNKRGVDRNPAPTRSASHDALNQRPDVTPIGGNMAAQKSRSHNASAASLSVETDV